MVSPSVPYEENDIACFWRCSEKEKKALLYLHVPL